jgi:predicted metal-binding membrane protein
VFETTAEPIKNPVTGADHRVRIDLPHGFEYSIAEIGAGTTYGQGVIELDRSRDSYAQFAEAGVLSPMMLNSTNALFAAGILLFAGLYQLTPIKQACLRHCRGPIQFLSQHWRPGTTGAFRRGLHHGVYCLGCCWGLMAILFFGGIMNLYWIIGLAMIVLLEKVLPVGRQLSAVTGGLFLAWGAAYLYVATA